VRIVESVGVFEPRHAQQLPDGRIAIPATHLVPEGMFRQGDHTHIGNIYLLSEADTGWVIDEMLLICIGSCDAYWESFEEHPSTPIIQMPSTTPVGAPAPLLDLLSLLPAEMT